MTKSNKFTVQVTDRKLIFSHVVFSDCKNLITWFLYPEQQESFTAIHAYVMKTRFGNKFVGVRDELHWEWIVQGSTPLNSYSYLYVSQQPVCCLFREGQWPYHGQDLLREAAFSYLHALGVRTHWYATLTLSSCQDASNYASRWSEAERGFLYDENWSMVNVILLLFPPQGWFPLMEGIWEGGGGGGGGLREQPFSYSTVPSSPLLPQYHYLIR